jgi:hypothetical protein
MPALTPGRIRAATRGIARRVCSGIAPFPHPRTAQSIEAELSTLIVDAEESLLQQKGTDADPAVASAYYERRLILKRLADGLAWHMFGADEHWMKQQSEHPPISYMARKSGYTSEREAITSLLTRPDVIFAMQNDATNVLRCYDVTFVNRDWEVNSIEVKTSTARDDSERAARQQSRVRAIAKYLRTDKTTELFPEARVAVNVDVTPSYYWEQLEAAVIGAQERGHSVTCCDDAVALVCNKRGKPPDHTEVRRIIGWQKPWVTFGLLNRHLDSMDSDEVVSVRPLTAFEMSPEAVFRLCVGDVNAMTLVNLDRMLQLLESRGLHMDNKGNGLRWQFCLEANERFVLGGGPWLRLIYSLLSVPAFVNLVDGAARENIRLFGGVSKETTTE